MDFDFLNSPLKITSDTALVINEENYKVIMILIRNLFRFAVR